MYESGAVQEGHRQVEHDDGRALASEVLERFESVFRCDDAEARARQDGNEKTTHVRVIFDDEDGSGDSPDRRFDHAQRRPTRCPDMPLRGFYRRTVPNLSQQR
jgi:hypothetical protein